MSVAATALVFLPVVLAGQLLPGADVDWPGWRGAGRDGWVSGFRPPTRWPERLTRVWQVEVGSGYGSPVVSGNNVYQHARQGDEEVVWRLDLETGTVKWRRSDAVPFTMGSGGERHGQGPKSSPALANGRLFTLSITGVLSAWDAESGELLWRRDYGSRFPKGHPYWGASTSPLVDGKCVVVHFGTDGQGALIALDTGSGNEVWSLGDDGPSYASPIVAEIHRTRQIIALTEKGLVSVDSKSGRFLWEYPFPQVDPDQNMATPVYDRGLVLLGGERRGVRGLEPRLDGDVWTMHERWHQQKVALNMSSAVINGDFLYGFSHYGRGRLFCLDPTTGEIRWEGPGRAGENVMLLAMPGYVVALVDHGELKIVAAAGDRFETVASYRVSDDSTWAPPVFTNSGILTKDSQCLTLWSLAAPAAHPPASR